MNMRDYPNIKRRNKLMLRNVTLVAVLRLTITLRSSTMSIAHNLRRD